MTWWLSFGLVWVFTAVGAWALIHGAATGDRPSPPPALNTSIRCAWCGGWLLTSAVLLGEIEGALISHGICDGCAGTLEEEGGLGADRVGQPGIRRSR